MIYVLWIVGSAVALFFGVLIFAAIRNRLARNAAFPIVIFLAPADMAALAVAGIPLPKGRTMRVRRSENFCVPLTYDELLSLYAKVMSEAQVRIGLAASRARLGRGGGALHGTTLAIGALAGYLHQAMLGYLRANGQPEPTADTGFALQPPVDPPPAAAS